MIPDLSTFYRVYTPIHVPLRFSDQYYRLAAEAKCVTCGRKFVEVVNCHPIFRTVLGRREQTPLPNPEDQKIIATFMVNVCDHGCGCSNPENFHSDSVGKRQPNFYENFKTRRETCLHGLETVCPNCEDCARPVRWLRWAPHLHTRECPVGRMKRTGRFRLSGFQSQVAGARSRR